MEQDQPIQIEEKESIWKGPLKYIIGVFLILLMVVWIIPQYAIPLDPAPSRIPTIEEVLPQDADSVTQEHNLTTREALLAFVNPTDPVIKKVATRVSSISCESGQKVCHAKALFYFVRNNLDYVADPVTFEYVEEAREVLRNGGGDCESGTLLLASMLESVGIDSEIVFIPGHAFLRIDLDEAANRYKRDDWIYLDWTCGDCEFGEVPASNFVEGMIFLDVY